MCPVLSEGLHQELEHGVDRIQSAIAELMQSCHQVLATVSDFDKESLEDNNILLNIKGYLIDMLWTEQFRQAVVNFNKLEKQSKLGYPW
jgi:hypothetical protein